MADEDLSWMDPDERMRRELQHRLGAGTAKREIEKANPLFDFTYTPPGMPAATEGYAWQNVGTEQQPMWSETSYQDIWKGMQAREAGEGKTVQGTPTEWQLPLGSPPEGWVRKDNPDGTHRWEFEGTPYEDIEPADIGTIETEPLTRGEELFGENPVTDFIGDIGQAGWRGFARARQVVPSIRVARGDESALPAYIRAQERVAALGQSDEMRQFNEYMDQSEGGLGDLFMALGYNPTIALTLPTESLVQYLNPAALGAMGTTVGTGFAAGGVPGALAAFPIGMGGAGAVTEGALSFHEFVQEELEKRNLPFSEAAVRKIMQDPELMAEMTRRARDRGIVVGAVDAVTAGVAGKVGANVLKAGRRATAPKPRYRGSGRLTPELQQQVGEDVLTYGGKEMVGTAGAAMLATESVGGMAGETAAQIVAGQDFDLRDVFLEGVGELGPGGVTMAKTFYAENFRKAARDAGVTDPGAMIELDPEAIAQMEAEAKAATLRDLELALDPAHGMGQLGAVSGQAGLTASGPGPGASVYGTPLTEPPLGLTDADRAWIDGRQAPEAQPSGRPVDFTGGALPAVGPDVAAQTQAQILERMGQQPAQQPTQQPLEDFPEAGVPPDAPGMEWREGTDLQTDEQPVTGAEPVDITPELSVGTLAYNEDVVDKIAEVADRNFGKSAGYFKPVRRDDPNLVAFVEGTHVEDEKGEPTVGWHGAYNPAQQEFTLRTDETGDQSRELHGRGIYIADDPSMAGAWSGGPGGVYPLWVSIKNPWYGKPEQSISPEGWRIIDEWMESETLTDEQESTLRENIKKNKWGAPEYSIEFLHPGMGKGKQELWVPPGVKTDALIASGYDGIRGSRFWIIFDPAQAKSAISNTGRFDPDEPKMAYQTIDDPGELKGTVGEPQPAFGKGVPLVVPGAESAVQDMLAQIEERHKGRRKEMLLGEIPTDILEEGKAWYDPLDVRIPDDTATEGRWVDSEEMDKVDWDDPKSVSTFFLKREAALAAQGKRGGRHFSHLEAQESSPDFLAWKGDLPVIDAAMDVDAPIEDGAVVRAFHGTEGKIDDDIFWTDTDVGTHFGTQAAANDFAGGGGRVYPAYIRLKRPYRIDDLGAWHPQEVAMRLYYDEDISFDSFSDEDGDVSLSPREQFRALHGIEEGDRARVGLSGTDEANRAILKANGYDSLVYENKSEGNPGEDSYVVFEPNQIKYILGRPEQPRPEGTSFREEAAEATYQTIDDTKGRPPSPTGDMGVGWTYDSLAAGQFLDFLTDGREPYQAASTPKSARQVAQYIANDPRATDMERYLCAKIKPMLRDSRVVVFDNTMINEPIFAEQELEGGPTETKKWRNLRKRYQEGVKWWGMVSFGRSQDEFLGPQITSFPGPGTLPYRARHNGPSSETIVHELLHAATTRQLETAQEFYHAVLHAAKTNQPAPRPEEYGISHETVVGHGRLTELREVLVPYLAQAEKHFRTHGDFKGTKFKDLDALMQQWTARDGELTATANLTAALQELSARPDSRKGLSDNHELISYGLTNAAARDLLQAISMAEVREVVDPSLRKKAVFTRLSARAWQVFTDAIYGLLSLPVNNPKAHTALTELLDNVDLVLTDLSPEGRKIYDAVASAEGFVLGQSPKAGYMGREKHRYVQDQPFKDPPRPGEQYSKPEELAGVMRASMGVPVGKYRAQLFELIRENSIHFFLNTPQRSAMYDALMDALSFPNADKQVVMPSGRPTLTAEIAMWMKSRYEENYSVLAAFSEVLEVFGTRRSPHHPPESGGPRHVDIHQTKKITVPSTQEQLPHSKGMYRYETTLEVPKWERRTAHLKMTPEDVQKKTGAPSQGFVENPYVDIDPDEFDTTKYTVPALWGPMTTTPYLGSLTPGELMNAMLHLSTPAELYQTFVQKQLDRAHPATREKAHRRAKILRKMIGGNLGTESNWSYVEGPMRERLLASGLSSMEANDFLADAKMADRLVLDGDGMFALGDDDLDYATALFNQQMRDDAFLNSTYYSDLDQQLKLAVPNLEEVSDRQLLAELVKAVDTTTVGQMLDVDFGTRPWYKKILINQTMRHRSLPALNKELVQERLEQMYGRRPMDTDMDPDGEPAKYLSPFKGKRRLQAMSHVVLNKVGDVDFALRILDRNIELLQEAIRTPSPDTKAEIRDAAERVKIHEKIVADHVWRPDEVGFDVALARARESYPGFNPEGKRFIPSSERRSHKRAQEELARYKKRVEYLLVKEKGRQERDRQHMLYLDEYRTRIHRALEHIGVPRTPTEAPGLGQPLMDIVKRNLAR